jgi:hypothetical protein
METKNLTKGKKLILIYVRPNNMVPEPLAVSVHVESSLENDGRTSIPKSKLRLFPAALPKALSVPC